MTFLFPAAIEIKVSNAHANSENTFNLKESPAKAKAKYWKETKTNFSNLITLKRLPNQIPATYPVRPQLNPTHLSPVPVEKANMKVAQT